MATTEDKWIIPVQPALLPNSYITFDQAIINLDLSAPKFKYLQNRDHICSYSLYLLFLVLSI